MKLRNSLCCSLVLIAALAFAVRARADAAIEAHGDPGFIIGAKLGGGLGAPLSDFGASVVAEIELGYLLPLPQPLGRAFELFVSGAYTLPGTHDVVRGSDARLPGDGSWTYQVDQRVFLLGAGVLFRLPLSIDWLAPYASLAWRGHMIETRVRGGSAAQSFGENRELGFAHGVLVGLGVDFFLGPGALLAELQLDYAGRDAYVLRDTNVGSVALLVGYRLMFGSRSTSSSAPEQAVAALAPVAAAPAPEAREPAPVETGDAVVAPALPAPAAAAEGGTGTGQIRGNVRAFSGEAVQATITVQPLKLKSATDAEGRFSVDVPPGSYSVRLRAYGYKSQSRAVVVTDNGVTVLNVELGKK